MNQPSKHKPLAQALLAKFLASEATIVYSQANMLEEVVTSRNPPRELTLQLTLRPSFK